MALASRKADASDFCAFYKRTPSKDWNFWLGVFVEDPDWIKPEDRILGMGGVYWNRHNVPIAFVDKRASLPALFLHREAVKFMNILKQVGEPRLYANCDETLAKAAKWLALLGFTRIPDRHDGLWVKELAWVG